MAVIDFKTSWLKDEDGAFYCPRTIIEAIQSASGKSFDNYVKEDIIAKSKITLLEDVNISNEKDKQFIVYNSTTKQWENKDMISVVTSYIDGINIAQITILGEEYNIIVPITNKSTLDELSTSEDGKLVFDGEEVCKEKVYSTSETEIAKWIDNSPIYEIVVPITKTTIPVDTFVQLADFPSDVKQVIKNTILLTEDGSSIEIYTKANGECKYCGDTDIECDTYILQYIKNVTTEETPSD